MRGSETSRARGVHLAKVIRNDRLCEEHFIMRLGLEEFGTCSAGHFVQLQCREPGEPARGEVHEDEDWREQDFDQPELAGAEPLLRRPFSLANVERRGKSAVLDIIYRKVGIGTSWMATAGKGASLSVLGPLGGPFPVFEDRPRAALVGGGVGIPPMMYLARVLRDAGKQVRSFSGFRTADLCFLGPDSGFDFPCDVASDDGTTGFHGFVTDAFDEWRRNDDPAGLVVYGCGPEPMLRALGDICIENGIDCYLSLERRMACGMGTCQSCVVKIADDSDQGWGYRLCCTDGPVFEAKKIIWT